MVSIGIDRASIWAGAERELQVASTYCPHTPIVQRKSTKYGAEKWRLCAPVIIPPKPGAKKKVVTKTPAVYGFQPQYKDEFGMYNNEADAAAAIPAFWAAVSSNAPSWIKGVS